MYDLLLLPGSICAFEATALDVVQTVLQLLSHMLKYVSCARLEQ